MRAHPAGFEQLLEAGPEQLPIVVVLLGAIGAVHDDSAYSARSQQCLVYGQIAQIREQTGPLVVVQLLLYAIVAVLQGSQRQSRVIRVASERVGGKRVLHHGCTVPAWPMDCCMVAGR